MQTANYLSIPPGERDAYVYRIVKTSYLFDMLSTRESVLVNPRLWQDPFENFILRSHFIRNGQPISIGVRDNFFGQCWTFQSASDAMWRIYSPTSEAVRIRTTIRNLAESLSSWRKQWAVQEAFIGKVQYLNNQKLLAFGRSVLQGQHGQLTPRLLARTLFVKRPAFRHEREVRLIFTPMTSKSLHPILFAIL